MRDRGAWLMEHPFTPPADSWLVLPLGDHLGVVIAEPAGAVGPESGAVLRLLGDLLGAGIAAARLRQELERTALERERLRLAAEVHDGLAQDLAVAMREVALLDSRPAPAVAEASRERLRAAVTAAHGIVRSRLTGMVAPPALGGLRPALEELCERFGHRGLRVRLECDARAAGAGAAGRRRGAPRRLGGAGQRRAARGRRRRRARRAARRGSAARSSWRTAAAGSPPPPARDRGTSACCSCASARERRAARSRSTARRKAVRG